ncbi:PucR family transcriptional regulator [Streptomyces sp. NPDC057575]|uniref:PucR family transcriptional regulator n=1 Tax=unclassified Streptomyces TaxID=2593676 RepID=UPI0036B011C1
MRNIVRLGARKFVVDSAYNHVMDRAKLTTTSATAEGTSEELFALANAVAAVIGGSVAIEDLDRRVLAYSSLPGQRIDELRRQGILDRHVPDLPGQQDQYREVLAATGVLRMQVLAPDELPRAAIAIRAGDMPLGTVWAIEGKHPLDARGEEVLQDCAQLAALHMLRRRSAAELDVQARETALRAALSGQSAGRDTQFALGLPERQRVTLLGIAPVRTPGSEAPPVVRLGAAAVSHWAAVSPEAAVATLGRTVYVLLPEATEQTARRLAEQALATLAPSSHTDLRVALSRPAHEPDQLPELRAEVDVILRVTTLDPKAHRIAGTAQAHARILLARFSDEIARSPRLRHPGIDAMTAYDHEHQTEYAASVSAWLDAGGNAAKAAEQLTIHHNTLKYRLRRARELFTLDLDHPDDRLSLWLQLRASRDIPPQ